jgi:hypothetical protein
MTEVPGLMESLNAIGEAAAYHVLRRGFSGLFAVSDFGETKFQEVCL